jgi:hypothetical protein
MDDLVEFIKNAYLNINNNYNNINIYCINNVKLLNANEFGCGTIISNNKIINYIKNKLKKINTKKIKEYQYNDLFRIIDDNGTKKTIITEIVKHYYCKDIFINISRDTLVCENNFPIINSYNSISEQLIESYADKNIECHIIYENNVTHLRIKMNHPKENIILFIQELFLQ